MQPKLIRIINKRWIPILGSNLLALAFLGVADGLAGQRGVPAQQGIANFGKVDDNLYRGAQPDEIGLNSLKRLGVKTIINLRLTNDVWKAEEQAARSNGMAYTNVPMSSLSRPTDEQVAKVLSLIETLPAPVYVHCQFGCDRTGTIVACYRIRHHKWTTQNALREAELYGMYPFELGMRNFVVDFGKSGRRGG